MRSPRVLFLLTLLACDGDGTTDPTPPAAPSALAATLSGPNIVVQWTDNSTDETEFVIEFARGNESFAPLAVTAANVTTYTHANVDRGQTYRYRVRACNGSECSAFAGPVETGVPLLAPTVVTENATSVTGTTATLRATVNPNAGATTVQFEYGTDATLRGASFTPLQNIAAGTAAMVVTANVSALHPSATYYVRAIATNSGGTTQGDIRTFATLVTVPPTPFATFAVAAGPTRITVGWQPGLDTPSSPATEYRIEARAGTAQFTQVGTVPAPAGLATVVFTHTNVTPNVEHTYRVRACNSAGCSAYSGEARATTSASPPVIVSSTVSASNTSAVVNAMVNPNGVATTVSVEYSTNANLASSTTTSAQPAGNGTSNVQVAIPVNGLVAGTTYYFRVIAQSAAGTSQSSIGSFATSTVSQPIPIITATAATGVGQTDATLNGTVNPNGSATTARFEWGTSPTLSSNTSFTPLQSVGSGMNATPFSAMLSGLTPGTTYYYRILASNSAGQSISNTQSFTTTAGTSTVTLNASASNHRVTLTWTSSNCSQTGSLARRRNGSNEGDYESILSNAAANGSFIDETYDVRYDSYTWRITLCGLTEFATLTGLRVPAPALSISSVSSNRIDLSWTDPSGGQLGFILAKRSNGVETSINLPAGTTIYADNAVTNGTEYGYDVRYARSSERSNVVVATPPGASVLPIATANAATSVTASSAALNGSVNPNGTATTARFEYGTTPTLSSGTTLTAAQSLGSGSSAVPINATVTGLAPSTTYYYRVVANNSAGQTLSNIVSFTTGAATLPAVTTEAASVVTNQSAQVNGSVNPNGALTTGWFEWGTSPTLATFSSTTTQNRGNGTAAAAMSATLSSLAPSTTYYYRAVAQNAGGTTRGSIMSFTTLAGAPTVTINATANPNYTVTITWSSTNCSQTGTLMRRRNGNESDFDVVLLPAAGASGTFVDDTYDVRYNSYSWRITLCGQEAIATVAALRVAAPVLSITNVSSNRIDLSWTDPSGGQLAFTLAKRSNGVETSISLPAGTTTYADNAVTVGTEYGYDVRYARSSERSNVVAATPQASSPPTVTGSAASSVTHNSAILNAAVNPNSTTTNAWFVWSTSPTLATPTNTAEQNIGSGAASVAVSQVLTGLSPSTTYYFRPAARNAGGTQFGTTILSFTTLAPPPAGPSAASAVSQSGTEIRVTWTDNSSNETSFVVEAKTGTNAFAEVASLGSNVISFNHTGLTTGTAYTYRVKACNSSGCSAYSNETSATPQNPTPAPPTVTTGGFSVVNSNTISVSVTGDPNSRPTTLSVEYGTDPTLSASTSTTPTAIGTGADPETRSVTLGPLTIGQTYYYRAVAVSDLGTARGEIRQVFVGIPGAAGVTATKLPGEATVMLQWSGAGEAEILRRRNGDEGDEFNTTVVRGHHGTSYADATYITRYESYTWRVRVCNAFGCGGGDVTVTGLRTPEPVLQLDAITPTYVDLSWSGPNPDNLKYYLRISGGEVELPSTARSYRHTGVRMGTEYSYDIRVERSNRYAPDPKIIAIIPPPGVGPYVETREASSITQTSAVVSVLANANYKVTTVSVEYSTDPTLSAGVATIGAQQIGPSPRNSMETFGLNGLTPNTRYYYRGVATNPDATNRGAILSFVTLP